MPTSHEQRVEFLKGLRAALAGEVDAIVVTREQLQMFFEIGHEATQTIAMKQLELINSGMVKVDMDAIKMAVCDQILAKGWVSPEDAKELRDRIAYYDHATGKT